MSSCTLSAMDAAITEVGGERTSAWGNWDALLRDRRFQALVAFIALFNAAFSAVILVRPFPYSTVALIDNLSEVVGPLVLVPLCFAGVPVMLRRESSLARSRRLQLIGAMLIGGGVLGFAAGQLVATVYEWVLKVAV